MECLNKLLFIWSNCPDKSEPVKVLRAMAAEACGSEENGGETDV